MVTNKYPIRFGSFTIKNGFEMCYWEDMWLENAILREQYLALYRIARDKNDTRAQVLNSFPSDISFRWDLFGPRLVSWHHLLGSLALIQLTQGQDEFH